MQVSAVDFAGAKAGTVDAYASRTDSLEKLTDRLAAIEPGVKYNKGRRGSVSAESMRPTSEDTTRVVIPKR